MADIHEFTHAEDKSLTRDCTFRGVEYRAMKHIFEGVGTRVDGIGPETDRLRIIWNSAVDKDDLFALTLTYCDLRLLFALAKIADGLNVFESTMCLIKGEERQTRGRPNLNAAEALVETLTEFIN